MRRFSFMAVGLSVAVVFGCGPGKEMPEDLPQPKVGSTPAAEPVPDSPATSDPAAKAVLDRAVKVITENVPGGLAKARVSRVTYQGAIQRPDSKEMVETVRKIDSVWPDRALVSNEFKGGLFPTMTFRLRRPHGWGTNGATLIDRNPTETGRAFFNDLVAQHWLPMGLVFADPKVVAYDPKKTAAGTLVKVAFPEAPLLLVTFNDASGLPVQVEYQAVEWGDRAQKLLELSDHKPFGGFMLPGTVKLTQNQRLGERWATQSWEFPETLDESLFARPSN